MATNFRLTVPNDYNTRPKSQELDSIANFMDSILKNMKSHNRNIQKNKINDISSISSDFKNSLKAAQGQILAKTAALITPPERPHTSPESAKRREDNCEIKYVQNMNSQNTNKQYKKRMSPYPTKSRTPSIIQNTKKNVINNNATKTNISRNSNIIQNSTTRNYLMNKPVVQQKASPRKMLVVYKENDKFVSRSLTTMLKQINGGQVSTLPSNVKNNRPVTSTGYKRNNTLNTNALHNTRSKSLSKPINNIYIPLVPPTAADEYAHNMYFFSNISRHSSVKGGMESRNRGKSESKKPSLYLSQKELMEKQHIKRSNHSLRPMSMNSESQNSRANNNNNIRTFSSICKPANRTRNKSPVTTNRNNTVNRKKSKMSQQQTKQEASCKCENTDTNKKEESETKTGEGNQEELALHINDMGDSSITLINQKLREIIEEMKEEKEIDAEETTCPESSSAQPKNKEVNNTSQNKPVIQSTIVTTNKPGAFQNNSNRNVNNNNKININKNQQSKQNLNSQNKNSLPLLVKRTPAIINSTVNSTNIMPKNPTIVNIPPNRKLSVLTPVEVVQDFINLVNRAKRDRKTFTVCGNYYSLRRAFAERGWIEKVRINVSDDKEWRKLESLSNFELVEGIKDKDHGEKYRRIFISKLLAGHQVDFYWDYMSNPFIIHNDKIKKTLINRFPFGASKSYTTKAGLCESLKEAYWYYIEGFSNIMFPRTYNLVYDDEITSFIDDFRRTATISLLQWITKNSDKPASIISPSGQIPTSVFNFATLQCFNLIKTKEHKDLDENIPVAKEYEWDTFLEKFYKIVHQGNHFKETQSITAPLIIDQAKYVLTKLKKFFPNMDYDGNMNLWLLKPNNGSCGCGIHVCRTLKYTLDTIRSRKDTKYVIQKYLERPLLIHNTKFDIRQYFLITCMPNFQIWLYKDCYLRFSSQMYDLSRLHESIHLTNNSIQCRYKNNSNRSGELPEQNMWHSDTFRRYLSDIGQPYAWRNTIYKGIKECLIGLFMLCQDKLLYRVNSFELCGADFMLAEDYRPHLIEINSRPALYPSTRITSSICPKVLEDVVKVTVDYARNPRASTGQFELIYKDTNTCIPPKNINTIIVEGINYKKYAEEQVARKTQPYPIENFITKDINPNPGTIQKVLKIDPSKVRKDVKNTLDKILGIIHTEQYKTDDEESAGEKNKQFRMMLSEFVDIISCTKIKTGLNPIGLNVN